MRNKLFIIFSLTLFSLLYLVKPVLADEVVVPDGTAIFDFITGDTTATGERNVPGRIYKLERGKVYIFTETLEVDFDFYLVADDDDPNNPTRPPMLVRGFHSDGSTVDQLININGDSVNAVFRNLLFQGVPIDGNYTKKHSIGIGGTGTGARIVVDNCVFNGWTRGAIRFRISHIRLFVTNSYFRNLVNPTHPFNGQSVTTYSNEDTLVYTNNTFFNTNSYIILTNPNQKTTYLKFDHNTVFTTIVNPFYVRVITNAEFTNNVFYGILALGQRQKEYQSGWFGFEGLPIGIMDYDTLSGDLLTEFGIDRADRRIVQKNNVWFNPQKFVDYWNSFTDTAAVVDENGDTTGYEERPLEPTTWMNTFTQAMFDDDATYPNLIDENTMYEDPQFDPTMTQIMVDSVVAWVSWWRGTGLEFGAPEGHIRQYDFTSDIFDLPWPLPETPLTYSNANLATASTEGLHLGDLNWYPDEKAQWLTDVKQEDNKIVNEFRIYQNYPNPFNPSTNIKFSVPREADVTLKVFNVLGEEVTTLVNKTMKPGTYNVQFNAKDLTSGIYFYTLTSDNFVQTKKMLLLK